MDLNHSLLMDAAITYHLGKLGAPPPHMPCARRRRDARLGKKRAWDDQEANGVFTFLVPDLAHHHLVGTGTVMKELSWSSGT